MTPEHSRFFASFCSFEDAQSILFGAPFDSTTSYRPGARFGPAAMREGSDGFESYSPALDRDLAELAFHDAGDLLLPFGNAEKALALIEAYVDDLLDKDKRPVMLGGEHLLSLAPVRALAKRYPRLEVLHLDAHTDLREEYLGERLSHATVLRRICELIGGKRVHSLGIRSGLAEEFAYGRQYLASFHPFSLEGLKALCADLKERQVPVYLSLDLDVLDPGYFPGTGTPEAGGPSSREVLEALQGLAGVQLLGFDLMELAPQLDPSGISTAVACKLLRELLLLAS